MLKGDINTPQEIRDMIEEMVLLDCANIGTVISHAWQFIQVEEVAP
jgi:HD-like signal output (HDOD) protein